LHPTRPVVDVPTGAVERGTSTCAHTLLVRVSRGVVIIDRWYNLAHSSHASPMQVANYAGKRAHQTGLIELATHPGLAPIAYH